MNEPNSVIGDLLQLTLLAGKKRERQLDGTWVEKNIIQPSDLKHMVLSSACTVPHVGGQDLFNFDIPTPQCLIINYVSLYTTLVDGSQMAVNYGVNFDIDIRWTLTINGKTSVIVPYNESQAILNSPCFLVFQGGGTVALHVSWPFGPPADSIYFLARANAYLADQSLYGQFIKYQSTFKGG